MEEKVKSIADIYGFKNQSLKLVEEMSELTQATIKLQLDQKEKADPHYLEELADVKLLVEQIVYLTGEGETVERIMQEKADRTIGKMKKAGLIEKGVEVYDDEEDELIG